jgi:hypothetical protein
VSDDEARVRARLHEYADGIEPLHDVPAAGRARYRRRVRRRRAAAVLAGAFAVIAAAGVGISLNRRTEHPLQFGTHGSAPTGGGGSNVGPTPPSTRAAGPGTVSGLPLADTSWVSDDQGWALVRDALLHTTDGGTTWTRVSSPPASVIAPSRGDENPGADCAKVVCVSHVRFADALHGWLFGRGLLTTSDGGVTWTRDTSAAVLALEVAHGRVFRVVSAADCFPPGCAYFVETATVGSRSWQRLTAPAVTGDAVQLLYEGPRIYVAVYGNPAGGAPAHIQLLRSLDAGTTWRVLPDPCGALGSEEVDTASLATAPGGFVVALCQPRSFDHGLFVSTSFDAGGSFGSLLKLPLSSSAGAGAIAAGSPGSIAVAARDGAALVVTISRDEGATWLTTLRNPVASGGQSVVFLGFEDDHTGRVAFTGDRLWTTRDAGDTWVVSQP